MKLPAQTIDAYLAALPEDKRAALEKLRQHIRALAPGAEECMSYQLPAFRLDGRMLVSFGAAAHHCALYPMSAAWIKAHHAELAGFPTSKGTIRFQPEKPLPVALVRKLIKDRIAQNAAKAAAAAAALRLTPKKAAMTEKPRIVQTQAQPTAIIRLTIPRAEIQAVMGPAIGEVMAAVAAQGLTPTGPVFSHHLTMTADTFDFEVGVPVAAPISPAGRVQPGQLPGVTVARTVYHGAYEGLGAAWGAFMDWIAAEGHTSAPDLWECYFVGPESGPDPAAWRTEPPPSSHAG